MQALLFVIIFSSLIIVYFYFRFPYVKQINLIPGPTGHPFLGVLYETLYTPENKRIEIFRKYFKKYGSLFQTWVGLKCTVHVANAEHAQVITMLDLSTTSSRYTFYETYSFEKVILSSAAHINKSEIYSLFKPWLGSGMFLSGGEKWARRRKIFTPGFHLSLLKDHVEVMVRNGQTLIARLEEKVDCPSFDLYPYLAECSLDIIGETNLGVCLDVQKGVLPEFITHINKFTRLLADRIQKPFMEWNFLHRFTKNYREQMESVDILRKISMQIIKQRMEKRREIKITGAENTNTEGRTKRKVFLDAMLDAYEEGDNEVNLIDVREELDGFVFAAYDSTSTALSWTFYLIGCHPEVQALIHAEIDEVLGTNGKLPDVNTISQLKYLDCVFKESLRLYPPAPIVARSAGEPIQLGNHTISPGTNMMIHIHLIQRSPEYYTNPDQFDPLRETKNPNAFLPFISGPRNCMGQKFATIEAMILLAMFFQCYEVESLTKMEDLTTIWNLIWRPEPGILVKIKHRK